jgi:hypothetical protein
LFYRNDVHVKPVVLPKDDSIEGYNIGIEKDPKYIKLSKNIFDDHKVEYLQLFKEYMDVFSWRHEDPKNYNTSIIQHKIPSNPVLILSSRSSCKLILFFFLPLRKR